MSINKNLQFVLSSYSKIINQCNLGLENVYFYILNNNCKYYLFIDTISQKIKLFNQTLSVTKYFELVNTEITDKFLLFEGYLYKNSLLLSDILYKDNPEISNYNTRYYKILFKYVEILKNLHINDLTINLHPLIESIEMLSFFKNHFQYKDSICSIEKIPLVDNFTKTKINLNNETSSDLLPMKIIKTNLSDVYFVKDFKDIDKGILYVKTIKESLYLKDLFKFKTCLYLDCKYNTKFSKWQIVNNKFNS